MLSLLGTLLTLVGVVLVLALVSENLIELIKSGFALKSFTRNAALEGLVLEASDATGLSSEAGEQIHDQVVQRLRGLGQKGARKDAIRLDNLDAAELRSVIESIDHHQVSDIQSSTDGSDELEEVARKAEEWFSVAMDAVDKRHHRRMRGTALLASAVIVIGLNVNAFTLLERARTDAAFRDSVEETVQELGKLVDAVEEQSANGPATEEVRGAQDSVIALLGKVVTEDDAILAQIQGPRRLTDPMWWAGIVVMILLVSLGAPFWHDLLGSLLGVRKKIQGQAVTAQAVGQTVEAVAPQAAQLRLVQGQGPPAALMLDAASTGESSATNDRTKEEGADAAVPPEQAADRNSEPSKDTREPLG